MKARYEQERGHEVDDASDIAIRLRVHAGEIYNMETTLDWTRRQLFAATATGEHLDALAAQRGITRRPATKSHGKVAFRLAETLNYAVPIPRGSVVATDEAVPVRFVTVEDGEIPQATYSAEVAVEAEEEGQRGNILVNAATVPVSVPAPVVAVGNYSLITGGSDGESDNSLRSRILASYTALPNGVNAAYYRALALSVDGVANAGVVERTDGYGTATVYVCGLREAVSDEVLGQVNALLSENDCVGAMVTAAHATLQAVNLNLSVKRLSGYAAADVREAIRDAFSDYLESLQMGSGFRLSVLGKFLLDTGCIESYQFDSTMQDINGSGSRCFVPGAMSIGVTG